VVSLATEVVENKPQSVKKIPLIYYKNYYTDISRKKKIPQIYYKFFKIRFLTTIHWNFLKIGHLIDRNTC
jgi:hypothetical protein